jgi:hypothetical protein
MSGDRRVIEATPGSPLQASAPNAGVTSGSGSRHDSQFHLHSSGQFLQVGRVGPVVLHRNWRQQVVLTGGTNLSRAVHADRQSFMVVPPVPPMSTTKSLQNWLQYHSYPRSHHRSHPVSRLSCLGMQKRVPEILERRLPSILLRARYARVSVSLHLGPPTCALR